MNKINILIIVIIVNIFSLTNLFSAGIIRGKITDKIQGLSLAGASVSVSESRLGSITNKNGEFTILNVPVGSYELNVKYLGFQSITTKVEVEDNKTSFIKIEMEPQSIMKDEVVVIGDMLKGQAKALNQQKSNINITNIVSADQVGRFPDANIGDAMKRMTGITVQYDQGEARFGLIRGTSPQLNSITINGDRIPSAEGDNRTIQLDLIPADMIKSVEINKALTADMDADAIGGSINLVTRDVVNKNTLSITLGSGVNLLSNKPILNGALSAGTRLLDNKFGISFNASYNNHIFGSDNIEGAWLEGPNGTAYLGNFEVRQYDLIRTRQSIGGGLDYKFNNEHSINFNFLYNHRNDWENRYRLRLRYDKGDVITVNNVKYKGLPDSTGTVKNVEIIRQNKQGINNETNNHGSRLEDQRTINIAFGGENLLFSLIKVNWQANWAKASEEKPNERYISYRDKKGVVKVNSSNGNEPQFEIITGNDLSKFSLYELYERNSYTEDKDFNGRIDFQLPWLKGDYNNSVKFGARLRNKNKSRNNDYFKFSPIGKEIATMNLIKLHNATKDNFLAGNYKAGEFPDREFAGSLDLFNPSLFNKTDAKEEYVPSNFDAKENIFAGYLQLDQNIGDKLVILAGLRIENTSIEYNANELIFDEDNSQEPYKINPTRGTKDYLNILPQINLKYSFSDNMIVRAAFTNAIARPNYYDLAPYRNIVVADNELYEGNISLKPTKSLNLDLMIDYYFESIGIFSAGIFQKSLSDYFYTNILQDYKDPISGNTFDYYYRPENGAKATLFGFEISFQRQLDFLPGILKGLGIYANYTFTTSEGEGLKIPGREQEKVTLPGTAGNMINASISYEMFGLNLRLSYNYTSDYILEFGASEFYDLYYDTQAFLDFNGSYEIINGLNIYTEINNITNQPLRIYQGKGHSERTVQAEFYNLRINAGIKYNLW